MNNTGGRKEKRQALLSMVTALCLAAGISLMANLAAEAVRDSRIYRQSKFATYIFSQASTGFSDIVRAPERVDTFVKFIGAVTAAYINFEMIPVKEADTFVAIFESLRYSVNIEGFSYHGKSLTITGTADDRKEYFEFCRALSEKDRFESVNRHEYLDTENKIRFELECMTA